MTVARRPFPDIRVSEVTDSFPQKYFAISFQNLHVLSASNSSAMSIVPASNLAGLGVLGSKERWKSIVVLYILNLPRPCSVLPLTPACK